MPDRSPDGALRWLLRQVRLGRVRGGCVSVLALLAACGTACAPVFYGLITDVIVDGADGAMAWSSLWWLLGAQVGLYAAVFACTFTQSRLLNTAVQRAAYRLRAEIERAVHRLPMRYFDSTTRGDLLSTMTVNTDNATTVVGPVLVTLPTSLFTIVTVTTLLFILSPVLAAIAVAAAPVSAVIALRVARRARPHLVDQWTTTAALTGHVEEELSARRMISAYGAEEVAARRFEALNDRLFRSVRSAQWSSGTLAPLVTTVNALVFLVLAVVGGLQVVDGALSLGAAQAVVLFAQQLSTALRELAGFYPRIQSGSVSASRIRDLLETPADATTSEAPADSTDRDVADRRRHGGGPPEIVFSSVDFGYQPGTPVLRSVDLTLLPGTTTAIVGATGSGKTTLTRLLQGFYAPDAGQILIDGIDIARLGPDRTRSSMAVVTQEPWLFRGTIRDNISYGTDPDGGPGQADTAVAGTAGADTTGNDPVSRAVADGHVTQIIATLPDGLNTVVGPDADNLSSGEKQLVTVARAIAAQPRILVLDEATSAADPRTELLIQQALHRLRSHTTTLLITHRLSTAARADRIVVLDDGRVVETGSHQELLAAEGVYVRRCRTDGVRGSVARAALAGNP